VAAEFLVQVTMCFS